MKKNMKESINVLTIELYLKLLDLLGKASSRDNSWRHLKKWLAILDKNSLTEGDHRPRVLVFSSTHSWTDFMLALSIIFIAKGYDVDFAWLPNAPKMPASLPYKPSEQYWIYRSTKALYKKSSKNLRLLDLSNLELADASESMTSIANSVALIDTSYLLEIEPDGLNFKDSEEVKNLHRYRIDKNLYAIRSIAKLLSENKYSQAVLPNGVVLEMGAVFRYLVSQNLPVSTLETWDKRSQIVYSGPSKHPVMNLKEAVHRIWIEDKPHNLTPARYDRVQKIINERLNFRNGDFRISYQSSYSQYLPEDITEWLRGDDFILMCPNIPYDSMFYVSEYNFFGSLNEWLKKTVEYLSSKSMTKVIVRSHPAERYLNSESTTESILKRAFSCLPDHIKILSSSNTVNTYALMDKAKFGIVYASTTAIEMAVRGIPVVCALNDQHFNGKGFTIDPQTEKEYFLAILKLLQSDSRARLDSSQIELAYCYADLYFNDFPVSLPIGGTGDFLRFCKGSKMKSILSRESLESWDDFICNFLLMQT